MHPLTRLTAALLAFIAIPATAATIGGVNYATQYDYREFYNAVDGKNFRVIVSGNPFPNLAADEVVRRLLPQMQANKPRPALTFTYDKPAEEPRPDYRLFLIFDAANDLGADIVCRDGKTRHKAGTPGQINVFAVYCRNDLTLSQTTAWTGASSPGDASVGQLFKELFAVVFTDSQGVRTQGSHRR